MAISNAELDYEYHIGFLEKLGNLSGNAKADAHWHRDAEYAHALTVCDAILDVHFTAVELAKSISSAEAHRQLNFGVGRRSKFIWLSLRSLFEIIQPMRTEPLPHRDVEKAARDLNVIYINIRGAMDNFAWCLLDLFCEEKAHHLSPTQVDLFGAKFLKVVNSDEVTKFIGEFEEWNTEIKERRNPAAHRIPLSVPPTILDDVTQKEYAKISAEYEEAATAALKAVREKSDPAPLFEKASQINERLQNVGKFLPLFVHHPDEGAMKIYPVVPQDIGQLVKVARGLSEIISKKVA